MDIKKDIKIFDDSILSLQNEYDILRKKIQNPTDINILIKIHLLFNQLNTIKNEIEDIVVLIDSEKNYKLSHADIERIKNKEEADDLFKNFLPYMLSYKLVKSGFENT